jgi:anti-sigma regulatory factor (Ser/Thr protein kinase)
VSFGELFALSFRPSVAEVAKVRRLFQSWLVEQGAEQDVAVELAVAFSELATNAVTAVSDDDEIETSGWRDHGDVLFEVTNTVRAGAETAARWDLDDPLRGGGRGLTIVRAFTDDVEVTGGDRTVTLRCRRRLAPR